MVLAHTPAAIEYEIFAAKIRKSQVFYRHIRDFNKNFYHVIIQSSGVDYSYQYEFRHFDEELNGNMFWTSAEFDQRVGTA